jgi:hypothetical protein
MLATYCLTDFATFILWLILAFAVGVCAGLVLSKAKRDF